jgi:serine/threonine protein kinase
MRVRSPEVPGYVLGPRLGGGPTADVFAAADTSNGRAWAIKVLRPEAAADPTNLQLFRRESRAGMAVRHPNLVRVERAGLNGDGPVHIVMDRVPGRSVRVILKEAGWLDPNVVGAVGRQSARALAALHAAGYVHGDVKPDNLHLTPGRSATLLDLGFAHRPGHDVPVLPGFVLGTANYVAPEQCHDTDADSPPADVFSLGVTLFELLTGELPYPTGSVEETMVRHRDDRPDTLWSWDGGWPVGMAALVDRMLDNDPVARPNASDVADELAALFPFRREAAEPVGRPVPISSLSSERSGSPSTPFPT